jgi:mannose/fructose/N-acetylgalactosamine-specific phosphotransferase system component IIB
MAVIFPDIEQILVAYFANALGNKVRVGTIHSQPDEAELESQVVITANYGSETSSMVTKNATVTLEVYAIDYAYATGLALYVEAIARDCVGEHIKYAEVNLGPVRTTEESQQEKRSIDMSIIVKGTDL